MQVDVNHVIDSLSQQVAEMAKARAIAEAQVRATWTEQDEKAPDNVVPFPPRGRGDVDGDQ